MHLAEHLILQIPKITKPIFWVFETNTAQITTLKSKKMVFDISYINQFYNKKLVEETYRLVKTNIIIIENTYKCGTSKSIRFVAEYMWADTD